MEYLASNLDVQETLRLCRSNSYAELKEIDAVFTYLPVLINFFWTYICRFFFFFNGPHLWQMEVPGLGAYATATQDLSHVCDLQHSSWQHWILNPLREARDRSCILLDTSWVHNPLSHSRNSQIFFFFFSVPVACGGSWAKDLNLRHSSDPSHCSDNTRSLIRFTSGEFLCRIKKKKKKKERKKLRDLLWDGKSQNS